MSAELIADIRSDYQRLVDDCERLYRLLERDRDDKVDDSTSMTGDPTERLVRVTELIEVLESVTYDRIQRLDR